MITCSRTNALQEDFCTLVKELDRDLAARDGEDHSFYAQYNTTSQIKHVIVAYKDGMVAGCGAVKEYDVHTMEVKRMYVLPTVRGQGIAAAVLKALEQWAAELGYKKCVLETGKKQPEAIALYTKSGYVQTPNYGQYKNVANSICFEKQLAATR